MPNIFKQFIVISFGSLLFDHNQPLDPNSMERDGPIRIGGIHQGHGGGGGQQIFEETMGQWLGEFCGKMPNQKGKKPGVDDSYLLAESSHNALTISWHSKNEQKADGEHKKEVDIKININKHSFFIESIPSP
jgi:hypothetical protein